MLRQPYFLLLIASCFLSWCTPGHTMQQETPRCTNCKIGSVNDRVTFSEDGKQVLTLGCVGSNTHTTIRKHDLHTNKYTDHPIQEGSTPRLEIQEVARLNEVHRKHYSANANYPLYTQQHTIRINNQTIELYPRNSKTVQQTYALDKPLEEGESIITATSLGDDKPLVVVTYPSASEIMIIDILKNRAKNIIVRDTQDNLAQIQDVSVARYHDALARATLAFVAHSNVTNRCWLQISTLRVIAKHGNSYPTNRGHRQTINCFKNGDSQHAQTRIGWDFKGLNVTALSRFACPNSPSKESCYHYSLARYHVNTFYPSNNRTPAPFDLTLHSSEELPLTSAQIISDKEQKVIISPFLLENFPLIHKGGPKFHDQESPTKKQKRDSTSSSAI